MTFRHQTLRSLLIAAPMTALALTAPASARPGGWGGPGWDRPGWDGPQDRSVRRDRSREGKVNAERFVADGAAAAALGHGRIAVTAAPGSEGDGREVATFEAAVVDQLAHAGYDVATPDPAGGQIAELTVTQDVVEPEEAPHKPLSGEMTMGVSNHGSMMGMALAYDATKPLKALIATRLNARIRDRTSGAVLWEGRADILTREGDEHWSRQAVAGKLAAELFDHFPEARSADLAAR